MALASTGSRRRRVTTFKIIASAGSDSKVLHGPERAGDVKHSRSSADKLRNAGWQPKHSLDDALATTLEFFRGR